MVVQHTTHTQAPSARALLGLALVSIWACGATPGTTRASRRATGPQPAVDGVAAAALTAPPDSGPVSLSVPAGAVALAQTTPLGTRLGAPGLPPAHAVWLAMVRGAKRRIDIGQFYIADRPGSRLHRVLSAVEAAAARGVAVRVLVDVRFARKYPQTLARFDAIQGITVRRLNAGKHLGGGVLHAKYMVVDDEDAWLGSQNFDWRSLTHIHELGVRIRVKPLVAQLRACFECDWALAGPDPAAARCGRAPSPPPSGAPPAQAPPAFVGVTVAGGAAGAPGTPASAALVASPASHLPPGVAWDLPALVSLIDGAKTRVRVQLLSLHRKGRKGQAFPQLTDALERAARRGVTVQLMVGHWSQSPRRVAELAQLHRVPGITLRFVNVPRFAGGFIPFARVIHSKYMIVDSSVSWVGTSNWGYGYFFTSRNVGLLVRGAAFAAQLDAVFDALWGSRHAADLRTTPPYPRPRIAR